MSDVLKSMFDAWNERLRSPFWGAIILAFLAFNWQPIWYLLFAKVTVEAKFVYWEEHACFWEPLFAGVFFALIAPLIKVIVTAWYKWPIREMRKWKDEEAAKRNINKVELDTQLQNAKDEAVLEQERAKEKAKEIGGDEAVEALKEARTQDKELRAAEAKHDIQPEQFVELFSEYHREILKKFSVVDGGKVNKRNIIDAIDTDFITLGRTNIQDAFVDLVSWKIIAEVTGAKGIYELTNLGLRVKGWSRDWRKDL